MIARATSDNILSLLGWRAPAGLIALVPESAGPGARRGGFSSRSSKYLREIPSGLTSPEGD